MATTLSRPPSAPPEDNNAEVESIVAAWYAGTIGRRDFLTRATAVLGSLAAATTLLEACGGSSPTATSAPAATTAATRPATSAAGSSTAGAAATTAPTTAPTTAAGSAAATRPAGSAAVTAAPAGTTAAGTSTTSGTAVAGSATTGTRPAGSAPSGTVQAVATGVAPSEVDAKMVQFKSGTADIIAYEARPKNATGTLTAVIVIHENMGLTDHIKDVTRRAAKEGFIGLGVDLLSRDGGTMAFSNPQDATAAINKLTDEQMVNDVSAAVVYLKGSGVNAPKVGIVGFCFGGGVVLKSSEHAKGLDAASAFYGPPGGSNQPGRINPTADAASVSCPLMGNYGALDPAIPVSAVQAFQDAAKASGKPLDFKIFDNAGHAFNNDTRPFSNGLGYVPSAATEAWGRTIAWFKKYLAS